MGLVTIITCVAFYMILAAFVTAAFIKVQARFGSPLIEEDWKYTGEGRFYATVVFIFWPLFAAFVLLYWFYNLITNMIIGAGNVLDECPFELFPERPAKNKRSSRKSNAPANSVVSDMKLLEDLFPAVHQFLSSYSDDDALAILDAVIGSDENLEALEYILEKISENSRMCLHGLKLYDFSRKGPYGTWDAVFEIPESSIKFTASASNVSGTYCGFHCTCQDETGQNWEIDDLEAFFLKTMVLNDE